MQFIDGDIRVISAGYGWYSSFVRVKNVWEHRARFATFALKEYMLENDYIKLSAVPGDNVVGIYRHKDDIVKGINEDIVKRVNECEPGQSYTLVHMRSCLRIMLRVADPANGREYHEVDVDVLGKETTLRFAALESAMLCFVAIDQAID